MRQRQTKSFETEKHYDMPAGVVVVLRKAIRQKAKEKSPRQHRLCLQIFEQVKGRLVLPLRCAFGIDLENEREHRWLMKMSISTC